MTENIVPFGQTRSLMAVDPAAVAAGEAVKARIQAAYIMAYQNPRNINDARAKILRFCESPEFAETVEYSKPIGGKPVKGLSIRFAEVALSTFRNVLTEAQLLYEDDDIKRIRISALDLEGNTQFSRDISIKKTVERKSIKSREDDVISERMNSYNQKVYLLRATEDEVMTKESAYVSKFIRTEGLRLLPADIKNEAIAKARETLSKRDSQDPEAAKKRILDSFSRLNIWPKDLEKYIGHSADNLSPHEIADLRTVYAAIESGEATWADYLQRDREPIKPPTAGKKDEDKDTSIKTAVTEETEQETGGQEAPTGVETPDEFIAMVKAESGKTFVFVPSKDGVAHDLLSAFVEEAAKGNNLTPSDMMRTAAEPGIFPGFWAGFIGGTWKQHYKGKLPEKKTASPAKEPSPPLAPTPESSSAGKDIDDSTNAFDVVDWNSNGLKKVGVQRFWDTNVKQWSLASIKAKEKFKEKWIRVFTDDNVLTKAFPGMIMEKESSPPLSSPPEKQQAPDASPLKSQPSSSVKPNYGAMLAEIQIKDPEGLIKACEKIGYGANLVIPMSEVPQKNLYEVYLKIKEEEGGLIGE
uniref:Uncharacterized protein n=1 Tax=viral metagenome TaxID=1070528 RepID=A0A6M3IXF9_9ZZZZ